MPRTDGKSGADRELKAIRANLTALEGLDGESLQRVLDYVFGRLSLNTSPRGYSAGAGYSAGTSHAVAHQPESATSDSRITSIRDLKDQKQPGSSNQMAALVAFYLSELAPPGERRQEVTSDDLQKYFKQAGFRLPGEMRKTLPNAAAAGYFDGLGGGRYKLNPVGYNLVVHGLPRGAGESPKAPKRKAKKAKRR
jgi:hypothetical protein